MCTDKDLSPSERDELTSAVNRLQMQVARQMATIRELQKQLAEAQRAGKRQAAPFSKGKRTTNTERGMSVSPTVGIETSRSGETYDFRC